MNTENNDIIICCPHCRVCSIKLYTKEDTCTKNAVEACPVCGKEVFVSEGIENNKLGKWILTKVKDERWGGWWFNYSCSHCGWTTRARPVALACCPNCGNCLEAYSDGSN